MTQVGGSNTSTVETCGTPGKLELAQTSSSEIRVQELMCGKRALSPVQRAFSSPVVLSSRAMVQLETA